MTPVPAGGPGSDDHRPHDHRPHDHDPHPRHGVAGVVRSVLAPHRHDTVESIDQALTGSTQGMRTLGISLAVLAATAVAELIIVVVSGSVALLGDTVHNFADALTAIPLGLAFWLGRRPETRRYTYGYGRAEDLAGIVIVAIIAASSAFTGWEAVARLMHPQPVHALGWVAVAGIVGFTGNEVVAHYRIRVGRMIGSAALVADGRHARADGITSLVVVVGALGVAAGWRAADPIVGLVITVAILGIVKNAARDIYRRLMDSVDPSLVDRVDQVLCDVPGVRAVGNVRIRWIGHDLYADVEIASDGTLSLAAAHAITEEARHRLLHDVPRLTEALIHCDPWEGAGRSDDAHSLTAHHFDQHDPAVAPTRHAPHR